MMKNLTKKENWVYLERQSRNAAGPTKEDHEGWGRKIAEWNSKTDRLLFEIARTLNMDVNPFDIQASYIPVAWGNEQQMNIELRNLLLQLLKNEISLSINTVNLTQPIQSDSKENNVSSEETKKV